MTLKDLQELVITFRDERNWKQFDNPKDCVISLSLEAAELLEHFQWKSEEEFRSYLKDHKEKVSEEMADILSWLLMLSEDLEIDLAEALQDKLKKNAKKYPIEKAKDNKKKYTEL